MTALSESGVQSYDAGGSKVWIGSQTTMKTTVKKASSPPSPATSGVMSIRSCGCGDQPRGVPVSSSLRVWSSAIGYPGSGGATASATLRVSWRRRSFVSVKIVMTTFPIWTMPESTIIAPKIPRAM